MPVSAPKIRLSQAPNEGFIQIEDGSIWIYVKEKNWDKDRQRMLCQHLGLDKTDRNAIVTHKFGRKNNIATGDLICYKKQISQTSCCVNLAPSTTENDVTMPYVKCKYQSLQIFFCVKTLCRHVRVVCLGVIGIAITNCMIT